MAAGSGRSDSTASISLLALELRGALKVSACGLVELQREAEFGETYQSLRQTIDRVVPARDRAVAALIFHFELIAQRNFFAGLDAVPDRLAVLHSDATALVQCEFGIDQVAMVLEQPLDSQAVTVQNFLVRLKRYDDIAIRLVAFLLVTNEIGNKGGRHVFVVAAAARIEIAVLLDQLERIERPVLAVGRHDVEMRQQQDRFAGPGAA